MKAVGVYPAQSEEKDAEGPFRGWRKLCVFPKKIRRRVLETKKCSTQKSYQVSETGAVDSCPLCVYID